MRVAFPVKVFLACAAVVAAGALPTYIYIETSFVDQLTNARVAETAHRASMLAETLRPLSRDERINRLRSQSAVLVERITYLGPTGVVLYDTDSQSDGLEGVGSRPEVLAALGRPATNVLDVKGAGLGAAKRESAATGVSYVYTAVKIDDSGEVVRLAFPARDVATLADQLRTVFRNSQAFALSVAMLLSVLAAFVFMRPLQRLARSAEAIAKGDYTASESWRGSDEIGDVGISLNTMAMDLRRRLANAESSETLLIQAADFVDDPIALIESTGEVLAINGAFRRAVEDKDTDAEEVLARVLRSKKYPLALDRAKTGECTELLSWSEKKIGVVLELHTLLRPASEPLVLLTVQAPAAPTLPDANEVISAPMARLVEAAVDRARPRLSHRVVVVDFIDSEAANMAVVEVEQRVELAIALFLEGAARGEGPLRLCVDDGSTCFDVWLDGEPATTHVRLVRLLLEPLGGRVTRKDPVTLHIPKA